MATKGKQIKLDPTQVKLLEAMARPCNIAKTTVLHGPEGSGKSLLAMEVLKMKLIYYMKELKIIETEKKVRVWICGTYHGEDRVPHLLRQFNSESEDIKDYCTLKVQPIKDLVMSSPETFQSSMKTMLEKDGESYPMTIVMLDELFPGFITDKWQDFQGIESVDFVLALRHAFNDGLLEKELETKKKNFQDVMEKGGVHQYENTVFCHLRQSYRCSQELINLMYYMLIHSPPEEKLYKQKSFFHWPDSISGKKPLWLEASSLEAFLKYTDTNEDLREATDVMVIYEPDNIKDVIQKLRAHCLRRKWKVCPSSSVMGSEASIVIIFDMKSVHFESISRAVLQLIFVTTQNLQ
mgnify:CR=1 FL=1